MLKICFQFPCYTFFVLLLQILFIASRAQNNFSCLPSTCGKIQEIKYPFRLKTDPQYSGDPSYELACNKSQTFMSINSRAFLVQSISYSNYTIRLVDPVLATPNKSCISLPDHHTGYDEIGTRIFDDFIPFNNDVTFINCDSPLNSSRFFETPICGKSSNSSRGDSYVTTGSVSDLGESCSIDMVASGSSFGPLNDTTSLDGIKNGLAYGFELSWYRTFCGNCENGFCSIENNEVTRHMNCMFGVKCRFGGFGDGIMPNIWTAIGSILGLRFACCIILLVVLVVY